MSEFDQFNLQSPFKPAGDQPNAIRSLVSGIENGDRFHTLEGVTGSGKTFTIANVIAQLNMPALVMSHNKTLAAQLYGELKAYFPDNAVEYFVSYYDYYQPEAYIPQTDTYIEKDASINKEIERMRLSATNSLLSRRDVIIVASVSCIYGLGSPEDYRQMLVCVKTGDCIDREQLLAGLVDIQYVRNDYETAPGSFSVKGDVVDVFPSYNTDGFRVQFFGDEIESITKIDPLTKQSLATLDSLTVSPAKHFVMPAERLKPAKERILAELEESLKALTDANKLLEAQRLKTRTMYDMEMLEEIGYCAGIENYSRHLAGRAAGEPPATLLDYFPCDFLTIVDESHVTLPQIRGMYNGDQARKQVLVDHGFRLPSAKDNRPLDFKEFFERVGVTIFVSATPNDYELGLSGVPVPQIIRPTGLIDPEVDVRPLTGQIDDLMEEVRVRAERAERVLVTTLTKRTAEDLSEYLKSAGLRVRYLHSGIDAVERVEVLRGLRQADFDCLVGINLLREGLDLPEVSLVAILDADKEGFLRSETAIIQTAGRAARNAAGKVILYADRVTDSMRRAIAVMEERRAAQIQYNLENKITPQTIKKAVMASLAFKYKSETGIDENVIKEAGVDYDVSRVIIEMKREMAEAAQALEFERAAVLRDQIFELEQAEELKKPPKS